MSMDNALQTFYAECQEMLAEAERLLIELEQGSTSGDELNALFRCFHTIKGSAGLFGFDAVVDFTHVVETVLDGLRKGTVANEGALASLLLSSCDHIETLVKLEGAMPEGHTADRGSALIESLCTYREDDTPRDASTGVSGDASCLESAGPGVWHLSLRFDSDVLRHGMDPAGFIRYLRNLGQVVFVSTISDALPRIEAYDPESCYLGFEIRLATDASRHAIEEVFEFVHEDCELRILSPQCGPAEYIDLIKALPEDDRTLGELFVSGGALTLSDLEDRSNPGRGHTQDSGSASRAPDTSAPATNKPAEVQEQPGGNHQFVRVRADKLDDLINLVGELVIAGAAAGLSAQKSGDAVTQEAVSTVSKLVEEVRDNSLQLRMVPIGETFQRFPRVVRDVSRELGKDIRLIISGGETELDKTMVEQITDPLTHLVRNAVDHGIEDAEERLERGKTSQGQLRLNAFHSTGDVVIEVSDDGGGLDRSRIIEKARAANVISDEQELSDSEVYQLIFEPGLSTADSITNLSGRGVGMDVVKRNIEALHGSIEVESQKHQGTLIRIRLPLTLAIIDGFLTAVGMSSYVIPLENVVECVELTEAQRKEARARGIINLRGEVMPCIRLREHFDLTGEESQRENILVVRHGASKVGLIVDSLSGECQTVIKPLGRIFANVGAISGSTILGDGTVALILDIAQLIQTAAEHDTRWSEASARR